MLRRIELLYDRHQHRLGFALVDLDEAVALELVLERCGKFQELLLGRVVLEAGEFLEWHRHEDGDVGFGFAVGGGLPGHLA